MPHIIGVILAGGRGQRLGGAIKANLKLNGITLLDRAYARLAPQVSKVILSTGHFPVNRIRHTRPMPIVQDAQGADFGPVSGLAAAVAWCASEAPEATHVLTVAVDTPFFPTDFAQRAEAALADGGFVAMAMAATQAYPTNALWRLDKLLALPEAVANNAPPNGLKNIHPLSEIRQVAWEGAETPNAFANINTIYDLLALARTAKQNDITKVGNSGLGKHDQTG